MIRKPSFVLLLAALFAALLPGPARSAGIVGASDLSSAALLAESSNVVVTNPDDGTEIAITVHRPDGASASSQVPVILHSHGWGGTRSRTATGAVGAFVEAGFGVVSIDQRGHGESGDQAHVQDPTRETEDIKAVIDYVAALDWVLLDRDENGEVIPGDPVLGAIGGSYGGGYQTMTALDEIADEGRTRFNALAPEITWFDLNESLAPQKVVRTAWVAALYAAGARMVPQYVHEAFLYGSATGQWPDGTVLGMPTEGVPDIDKEFHKHGPVFFTERGIQIDVPVLLRQGSSDNLFNLNQGLQIFDRAVTEEARESSFFVAYNGGHALPNALPAGTSGGSDACSPGGFTELSIAFFKKVFAGAGTDGLMPARYNFTTADGSNCLSYDGIGYDSYDVALVDGKIVTPAGAGAPIHIPVAEGPLKVSGIPKLSGNVTSAVVDTRAFFGLSVGTTPADALVVQNNVMPLRRALPVQDDRFEIELPGVAVEVPEGQTLYLTVSPVADMYAAHGSRVPGAFVLSDTVLELPRAGSQLPGGEEPPSRRCGPPEGKGGNGNGNGNGSNPPCGPKDKSECGPPDHANGQGNPNCDRKKRQRG